MGTFKAILAVTAVCVLGIAVPIAGVIVGIVIAISVLANLNNKDGEE